MQTTAEPPRPVFRPFNPNGPLTVYVRNLPHWRQPGATYFVTFRLGDSIPAKVLEEWQDLRNRWYQAHSLDLKLKKSHPTSFDVAYSQIPEGVRTAFERQQAKMLHEELDRCHGSCILRDSAPRNTVIDSLRHFHGQRLWLGDWVTMPNHIHALITPIDDWELTELLGAIKKWSSRLIGKWLAEQETQALANRPPHSRSRLWQHESYDRIIRDVAELTAFRRYVARNPGEANLSDSQYEYAAADWLDEFAARPVA